MNIDWLSASMILVLCGLWCWVGFELCKVTHRQRGIEADRPVTDNIPDYVPDSWSERVP